MFREIKSSPVCISLLKPSVFDFFLAGVSIWEYIHDPSSLSLLFQLQTLYIGIHHIPHYQYARTNRFYRRK
jgi:hypothetical protein